jgi:hypothetical protein
VGTTIAVTGTGWPANDRVVITLTPPRVQPAGQARLPVRVRVDRNGNFRATITVPADERLIREPELWVAATGSRGARAIALFAMRPPDSEVAPTLPITPLPPPA